MTVAELIEQLREMDQTAEVWIYCPDDYYTGPVTKPVEQTLEDNKPVALLKTKGS